MTSAPSPQPPRLSTVSGSGPSQTGRSGRAVKVDARNALAALFLLIGVAAISYGAWLLEPGVGFMAGGVLFIAWVWLVVIDFPTAGRA